MHPLIKITDSIQISTYVLIVSLSLTLAAIWTPFRARRKKLSPSKSIDLLLSLMVGGLLGARLLHVFYEQPQKYLADPLQILMIWQGGFVFYGGAIGSFLAGVIFLKTRREKLRPWLDLSAPVVAFSYGLGRLGCFFNGCCYGRVCHLPWAVYSSEGEPRHPTQLYAALIEWGLGALLLLLEKRKSFTDYPGRLFFTWLLLHAPARIFMELFRDDFRGPFWGGLSISTWVSLLIFGLALWGLKFTLRTVGPHKST